MSVTKKHLQTKVNRLSNELLKAAQRNDLLKKEIKRLKTQVLEYAIARRDEATFARFNISLLRELVKERDEKQAETVTDLKKQGDEKLNELKNEIDSMKECQLCFELYDCKAHRPAIANCMHVFCKDCLTKHSKSKTGCPMCRNYYHARDIRELHFHFV